MGIQYEVIDGNKINSWNGKLHKYARSLDLSDRCNSAAVDAGNLDRTFPSIEMIDEFVKKGALVAIAHQGSIIKGYIICTDDTNGKYGGCYCRWIAADGTPEEQAMIFEGLGKVATDVYGWLWGRVGNDTIRNIMLTMVPGCELLDDDEHIVTFKKP